MNEPFGSDNPNSHCSIVGLLGILIQISLGVLSFSVLIIKRIFFENPKRPWKIWRFDTAKQGISQILAHFINLTISLVLTVEDPNSDTCLWYFITNVFDNTVGVFLCVFSLRLLEKHFYNRRKYYLISGNYYQIKQQARRDQVQHPQENQQRIELSTQKIIINYKAWILQLIIWNSIVIVAKMLLFILQFILRDLLDTLSKFLLGWIQAYPNLQLVVVIVIVPVIMNGLAFWVQDNFLKKREIPEAQTESIQIQLQVNHQAYKEQEDLSSGQKNLPSNNQNSLKIEKQICIKEQGQTMDGRQMQKKQQFDQSI